jgi:hypothetical protein
LLRLVVIRRKFWALQIYDERQLFRSQPLDLWFSKRRGHKEMRFHITDLRVRR